MRSVNVSELKDRLSTYLTFAQAGEVVVISDRDLPVAKLVPFTADDVTEEDLALAASGVMRLPEKPFDVDEFLEMPLAVVSSGPSVTDTLLEERASSR